MSTTLEDSGNNGTVKVTSSGNESPMVTIPDLEPTITDGENPDPPKAVAPNPPKRAKKNFEVKFPANMNMPQLIAFLNALWTITVEEDSPAWRVAKQWNWPMTEAKPIVWKPVEG